MLSISSNGVSIEVGTASFRSVRGYTMVAALLEEIAFWPTDDAADPDYEILDALRLRHGGPFPERCCSAHSSPYARRNALFDAHRRHYGREGDPVLLPHAPTLER